MAAVLVGDRDQDTSPAFGILPYEITRSLAQWSNGINRPIAVWLGRGYQALKNLVELALHVKGALVVIAPPTSGRVGKEPKPPLRQLPGQLYQNAGKVGISPTGRGGGARASASATALFVLRLDLWRQELQSQCRNSLGQGMP